MAIWCPLANVASKLLALRLNPEPRANNERPVTREAGVAAKPIPNAPPISRRMLPRAIHTSLERGEKDILLSRSCEMPGRMTRTRPRVMKELIERKRFAYR